MAKNKNFPKGRSRGKAEKKVAQDIQTGSNIHKKPVWRFDKIDRNGEFSFDLERPDFNHKLMFQKFMDFGEMEWNDIDRQTHDSRNKSKNHYLSYSSLSKEAKDRINQLHLEEDTDTIYSIAFENKLRVIGLRYPDEFHVVWFDPNHKFCPSKR